MVLKKSGYSSTTAKNYIIDAGVVYTNVTFDSVSGDFTGTLQGATSGGVTLTIEQSYRDIEIDGATKMKVKGNKVLESANATITANMKELTAENIRKSLNGSIRDAAADEAPAGYKVIESKLNVDDTDYISNMAVVGRLSGTNKPIIAILDNVLCTSGLELGTEDNNEAVVEQTYEAHATTEQLEAETFPWRILYPGETTTGA
jgi:hypothetical protein